MTAQLGARGGCDGVCWRPALKLLEVWPCICSVIYIICPPRMEVYFPKGLCAPSSGANPTPEHGLQIAGCQSHQGGNHLEMFT